MNRVVLGVIVWDLIILLVYMLLGELVGVLLSELVVGR